MAALARERGEIEAPKYAKPSDLDKYRSVVLTLYTCHKSVLFLVECQPREHNPDTHLKYIFYLVFVV